jgi:hypothetical protein
MQDALQESLKILCERAAHEQNLDELLALVQEINNLLEEKSSSSPAASRAALRMPDSEVPE